MNEAKCGSLERPVFLVGAERSGTTVFRLMLMHHPELAFMGEFEFAVDRVDADGHWPELGSHYEWLSLNRIFLQTRFQIDKSLDYPELCGSFLAQHLEAMSKPLAGATIHRHFDRILRIWPEAQFIHLVRDPRDVARSNIGMGWAGNVWHGIDRWIEAEDHWDRVQQGLSADRWIHVRYEDLISNPEEVLARVCGFIGITYSADMLNYHEHTTYEPPDPSLLNQWRKKLTEREIRQVEARIGDRLVAKGYEESGLPKLDVSAPERAWLRAQDWRLRKAFAIRRFGWRLVLTTAIARRLPFRGMKRRALLAMNAIEKEHLQ